MGKGDKAPLEECAVHRSTRTAERQPDCERGVVWIQSNAIAHKHYYKVMDIVRKNNIRVCYFQFASAEKCAEQFAMDELGVKE